VEIDVAPGQLIDVDYADDGGQPPVPLDQLCAGARAIADAVLTTLLSD
jgi:hypothetical protein